MTAEAALPVPRRHRFTVEERIGLTLHCQAPRIVRPGQAAPPYRAAPPPAPAYGTMLITACSMLLVVVITLVLELKPCWA
jgi:hypothetical protein